MGQVLQIAGGAQNGAMSSRQKFVERYMYGMHGQTISSDKAAHTGSIQ